VSSSGIRTKKTGYTVVVSRVTCCCRRGDRLLLCLMLVLVLRGKLRITVGLGLVFYCCVGEK
jgi:hypothetical protein